MRAERPEPFSGGRRLLVGGAAAALAGGALLGLGWWLEPHRTAFAYLTVWSYAVAIALGALIFNLIAHAMKAEWPLALRRLGEAVSAVLPLLALLFIPIALSLDELYPWVTPQPRPGPAGEHYAHALHHKAPYLDVTFFLVRAALYFGCWIAIAELLRRWSLAQDAGDHGQATVVRARAVGAAALPIVGLTLTFASFDWLMSLMPEWFSTAFGLYYFAEGFLGGICLLVVLARALERQGALAERVTGEHYSALGRMMFAFTTFWAYIAFFQALIIYMADKPEEVVWYLPRIAGSWKLVLALLIVGHFAVPFAVLLLRGIKFRGGVLAALAAWQLFMGLLDFYWLALPALQPTGFSPHWVDLAAVAAVIGASIAFAVWRQQGHALAAHGDPRYPDGVAYRNPSP